MNSVVFRVLRTTELIDIVQQLDPRLGATPAAVLVEHDRQACEGLLRRWVQTIQWLDSLEVTEAATAADLAAVASRLPTLTTDPTGEAVRRPRRSGRRR